MNIVYAVKIFGALSIIAFITRLIAGPGLRAVLQPKDFNTVWIGIIGTLAVSCFSVNVGLFFVIFPIWVLILSNMLGKDGDGRLAAYGLLCCVSPPMRVAVQHIGPLNDLILLTPFRILSLFLLLPEAIRLFSRRDAPKQPGWLTICDLATVCYALYWLARHFGVLSLTVMARETTSQLLDLLLPYYVLTRSCAQLEVRHRFLGFVLAGSVYEAFTGMIETITGHTTYGQLQWLYGVILMGGDGLRRGSLLRAMAGFPGPLPLAVLLLFGIGVWFALRPTVRNRPYLICLLAMVGGLLATYGRGQILAGLVFFFSLWLLRFLSAGRYLVAAIVCTVAISVAWHMGLGDFVTGLISTLSAGDATADFNVRYRQVLLDTALALLKQSPWFGVPNYLEQMEGLRQGEGIIDLVNTYLVVALNSGVVGIAFAFTPFLTTLWRSAWTASPSREGTAWVALTVAFMAAIFTVSPVSIIQPVMVWVVALALGRQQQEAGGAAVRKKATRRVDVPLPLYASRGQ